jgi:hypothetical protein
MDLSTALVIYFYYSLCARPILWILGITPYIFNYQVIEIKNKNEFIIHRYWYNILIEILYFLLLPMEVKYISL